jgi:hypothetical protein
MSGGRSRRGCRFGWRNRCREVEVAEGGAGTGTVAGAGTGRRIAAVSCASVGTVTGPDAVEASPRLDSTGTGAGEGSDVDVEACEYCSDVISSRAFFNEKKKNLENF